MKKAKESAAEVYAAGKIVMIPIEKLAPHPENVRKKIGDVSELAASIRQNGVLQNLTVVRSDIPDEGGSEYLVVIGNRRLAAAKQAGLSELPCVIVDMTKEEQIKTMLCENIQRNDLTPMEEADGFQLLLDFGETLTSIAADTGMSESTVRRRIRLKEVADASGKDFSGRQISFEDLDRLYKIKDEKKREKVGATLGTNDFEWEYKNAIEEQNKKENTARWKAFLEASGLQAVSHPSYPEWCYEGQLSLSSPTSALAGILKGRPESEFGYDADLCYGVYIRRRGTAGKEAETPEQKAARERDELNAAKKAALKEAEARAFELRSEFVRNVSNKTAGEHFEDIVRFLVAIAEWEHIGGFDHALFFGSLGAADPTEDEFDEWDVLEAASPQVEARPSKTLLALAYAIFDDSRTTGWSNWRGEYYTADYNEGDREGLNALYDLLAALGYEASTEELALRDGTSSLYLKEDEV